MTAFVVFVLAGIGTYLARGSFILAVGEREIPHWAEGALRNVGPAVLAALITSLLVNDGVVGFVTDVPKVVAVVATTVAALRLKSFLWPFAIGMTVYWVLGWAL